MKTKTLAKETLRIYLSGYLASYLMSVYGPAPNGFYANTVELPEYNRLLSIVKLTVLPPPEIVDLIRNTRRDSKERFNLIDDVDMLPIGVKSGTNKPDKTYIDVILPLEVIRFNRRMIPKSNWRMPKAAKEEFVNEVKDMFWSDLFSVMDNIERDRKAHKIKMNIGDAIEYFMTSHSISLDYLDAVIMAYWRKRNKKQ